MKKINSFTRVVVVTLLLCFVFSTKSHAKNITAAETYNMVIEELSAGLEMYNAFSEYAEAD